MPEQSTTRKTRSRTACKQCRQAKVKCGMESVPCARCKRLGYECEWNPDFKRKRNQDRVSQLEHQVEMMMASGAMTPREEAVVQETPSQRAAVGTIYSTRTGGPTLGHGGILETTDTSSSHATEPSFSVLDVRLSLQDVTALFSTFFEQYHPHMPCLESSREPEAYFKASELLFWSVIATACRQVPSGKDLLGRLAPYFTSSLGSIMLGVPKQLQLGHVQALILLSLWPPVNVTFWGDRSAALAHLAVTTAMFIGLHKPGFEQEYSNRKVDLSDEMLHERRRSWVACVAAAQNLAMDSGISIHVPFGNHSIAEICSNQAATGVSPDLIHYLLIQREAWPVMSQFTASSTYPLDLDALLTAISIFEASTSRLSALPLSPLNRIRLLTTSLHVYTLTFNLPLSHPSRRPLLIKAYTAASSLINTAISEDSPTNHLLSCSPRTTYRALHLAACLIFKLHHSAYRSSFPGEAKLLFNAALLCVRQQAVEFPDRKDLPVRSNELLRGLWELGEKGELDAADKEPEVAVLTRGGVGVVYDCLAMFAGRLKLLRRREQGQAVSEEVAVTAAQQQQQQLEPGSIGLDWEFLNSGSIWNTLSVDQMMWDTDLDFVDSFGLL